MSKALYVVRREIDKPVTSDSRSNVLRLPYAPVATDGLQLT